MASERYQEELNVRFVVAENNRVVKPKCSVLTKCEAARRARHARHTKNKKKIKKI